MTQGFPAQPQYGQMPPQQYPPQGYAPPAPPATPNYVAPPMGQPMPAPQQYAAPAQPGGFFQTQDPHIRTEQGPAVPPAPQPGAAQQTDTTGFWGGAPSLSFDAAKGYPKGTFRGGQVLSKTISNQTDMATKKVKTWDDGSPRKQMVLLLQTSERADPQDNGQRQLFIKGDLPRACREAFQAAGASDIEIGSWVYAAWIDEKPGSQGKQPAKVYKVVYARPGQPDPMPASVPPPPPQPQPQYAQQPQQFAAPQPDPSQVIAQMPMPVQAYPGQGPAPQPQYAQPAPEQPQQFAAPQVPADQAAQFAAWQAQQAAAQQPQPGGQPNGSPVPQQAQPAPQGQPQQWSPFA